MVKGRSLLLQFVNRQLSLSKRRHSCLFLHSRLNVLLVVEVLESVDVVNMEHTLQERVEIAVMICFNMISLFLTR